MINYIVSTEPYLVEKRINEIMCELSLTRNDFNFLEVNSDTPFSKYENFCNMVSFFGGNKLAIIKNIDDEKFIPLLESTPQEITTILVGDLDKRKKLYKFLKKNKYVNEIKPLSKKGLSSWVSELGTAYDTKISNAAKILELTGEEDMINISREVEKLCFMRKPITSELIEDVVSKSLLINSFDLTNAILAKKMDKAFEILDKLSKDNQEMIPLIALLNKNFNILKALREVHEDDLKDVGVSPFVIRNLRQYRKNFNVEDIDKYSKLCQQLDFDLKNGYDQKLVMQILILSIGGTI